MLLTCENCETIFRIESAHLKTPGQKVRCSVCKHVWAPEVTDDTQKDTRNDRGNERFAASACDLCIFDCDCQPAEF